MKWLVVMALVACNDRSAAPPAKVEPTIVRPVTQPEEPGGIAGAAQGSRPRSEWPCGERYVTARGETRTRKLIYGTVDACKVPLGLVHLTLGGCPVANAAFPDRTIAYDERGRLVHALHDYAWGTVGLLRKSLAGKTSSYAQRDGKVMLDGKPREIYAQTPAGQLRAIEIHDDTGQLWSTELDYEGPRIIRVREVRRDKSTMTEVLYDCAALP